MAEAEASLSAAAPQLIGAIIVRTMARARSIQREGAIQGTSMMAEKSPPSLDDKKDLIIHTYDSFLIAQTRLFIQATSDEVSDSSEINRRRELLLLDDLIGFAIAARRLIELTSLKSFANRCMVPFAYLDRTEEPYSVMKSTKGIGFHSLMNRLIHASFVEHFNNKLDFVLFFTQPTKEIRFKILWDRIRKRRLKRGSEREPIEQLLIISSDNDADPVLISIKDMIVQSTKVSDKVIDTCSRQKIFLELSLRDV